MHTASYTNTYTHTNIQGSSLQKYTYPSYKNEFNVYFIFIYLINTQLGMSVCPIRVKMREHVSMELVTTAASVDKVA